MKGHIATQILIPFRGGSMRPSEVRHIEKASCATWRPNSRGGVKNNPEEPLFQEGSEPPCRTPATRFLVENTLSSVSERTPLELHWLILRLRTGNRKHMSFVFQSIEGHLRV